MSGDPRICFLCGGRILETRHDWLGKFRALHGNDRPDEESLKEPRISGLGDYTLDGFVPTNYHSNRNDAGLTTSELRGICDYQSRFPIGSFGIRFPGPPPPQTAWGFLGHDACWTLLARISYPNDIDTQSLVTLCFSSPFKSSMLLDIGIDYGEIYKFGRYSFNGNVFPYDYLPFFPGEEREVLRGSSNEELYLSPNSPIYMADPLQVPALTKHARNTHRTIQYFQGVESSSVKSSSRFLDRFNQFPNEILESILRCLSSKDVLHIRLVSATFAALDLGPAFWASRFHRGFEFHCLLDPYDPDLQNVDWRQSYNQAKALSETANFKNRKRIWAILMQLTDFLQTMSMRSLRGIPCWTYFEQKGAKDQLTWKRACGNLHRVDEFFSIGCRELYMRMNRIPLQCSRIFVTLITTHQGKFVSGLKFLSKCGRMAEIGYNDPEETRCLVLNGNRDRNLVGFKIGTHSNGIRSVGILYEPDDCPDMLGDSEVPSTLLEVRAHSGFVNLKCGFDGFKMVSFAINENTDERFQFFPEGCSWWPRPPGRDLCLSKPVLPQGPLTYRPLTTCIFGGQCGSRLRDLIEIVALEYQHHVYDLQFRYHSADNSTTTTTCSLNPSLRDSRSLSLSQRTLFADCEKKSFRVDGPNGEIITSIDTSIHTPSRQLNYFRIRTNHGRSATFTCTLMFDVPAELESIEIPSANTIIGLYSELTPSFGMRSLGVISRKL